MRLSTLLLVIVFITTVVFSQNLVKRTNNWYSANNLALDFTCSPFKDTTGCQINNSEGSSTMSDLAGNLLFYCNGEQVWDKTNTLMPNGSGLLGDISTVQGSVIVPNPSDPNKYYIFTAGTSIEDQGINGVRFSEVDMTLNGGNGDVLLPSKNTLLFAPNEEKLTAVRNATNTGYWVAAQEKSTNKWYAYEVTGAGVNMTPVISTTGPPARVDNSLGALFSPDGKWLVSQNVCGTGAGSNANLTLYSFDNSTGAISYAWSDCGTIGFKLAFSPNSNILYAAGFQVNQYNLAAGGGTGIGPDTIAVKASKTLISTGNWQVTGGMQLGPDCNIYFTKTSFGGGPHAIGVISDPNIAGTGCNYQPASIPVSSGSFGGGFPNFVTSFFEYPCTDSVFIDLTATNTTLCSGGNSVLQANVNNLCGYTLTWNTPLNGLGPHTVSPSSTTTYQVIASNSTNADTATITIVVGGQNAGIDTAWTICNSQAYDLDTLLTASADIGGNWFDQTYIAIPSIVNPNNGQNIYHYVIGTGSCADTATYTITQTSSGNSTVLGNDTSICSSPYILDATTANSTYSWSDFSTTATLSVNTSGLYWVDIIDNISGCSVRDSINLTINTGSTAGIDTAWTICNSQVYDLDTLLTASADIGGNWFDHTYTAIPSIINPNNGQNIYHYVIGTGSCADTASYTITQTSSNNPNILGNDTNLCTSPYVLDATTANSTYSWSDFSTAATLSVNTDGVYWVEIIDNVSGCSSRDSINLTFGTYANAGKDSNAFLCNGSIDLYPYLGATATNGGTWIDPLNNPINMPITFASGTSGIYTYINGTGSCLDSAFISLTIVNPSGNNIIGNDTTICKTDSYNLFIPTFNNTTFLWQDGSTMNSNTVVFPVDLYWVEVTDIVSGCSTRDTLNITYDSIVNAGLDSSISFCSDTLVNLTSYLRNSSSIGGTWLDPNNNPIGMPVNVTSSTTGNYTYILNNNTCNDTANINLAMLTTSSINLGNDTTLCWNDSLLLYANMPNTNVTWSTGSNSNIEVIKPNGGKIWVQLIDINNGCSVSDTINVAFSPIVDAGNDSTLVLCSDNQVDLGDYLTAGVNPSGGWFTNSGASLTMPFDPFTGQYYYVLSNGNCNDTAVFSISIQNVISTFSFSPDVAYSGETTVVFNAQSNTNDSYSWLINNLPVSSSSGFSTSFQLAGEYIVCLASSLNSCTDTSCVNISVNDQSFIYVPSSFTPNGDGENETFKPSITGDLIEYNFYIFNRWGEMIFNTDVINDYWDGTHKSLNSPNDVYTWRIIYKIANEVETRSVIGHVTLVR